MTKTRQPFDYRKFFRLLGLMGIMLLVTLLAMAIMISLYAWVGSWGVAAFLVTLFVASRLIVRHFVPRMLAQHAELNDSVRGDDESPIHEKEVVDG